MIASRTGSCFGGSLHNWLGLPGAEAPPGTPEVLPTGSVSRVASCSDSAGRASEPRRSTYKHYSESAWALRLRGRRQRAANGS